ncbi:MAG: M50 family metallopeptidase [Polyangiales bacterium]
MDFSFLLRTLLTIAAIGVLMIVHEGGHYLAARAFGMRVTKFSIGFGPTLYKKTPAGSETEFRIGLLPFFAYVYIAGMNPYEEVADDDPALFPNKGVFARIAAIAAGPIANYLFASLVVFGVAMVGWPEEATPTEMVVGEIQPGSAAATAGVHVGDVIIEAGGRPVRGILDVQRVTQPRAGQATDYVVRRAGRAVRLVITPKNDGGVGRIGVSQLATYDYVPQPAGRAAYIAVRWPWERVMLQLHGIGEMIRGATIRNLGGPVRMVQEGAKHVERGSTFFLLFVAFVSTGLALFNALPFPMLDGGRLLFLAFELVTRRKADPKVEAAVHTVGFLFLLGLMVIVTFQDFQH